MERRQPGAATPEYFPREPDWTFPSALTPGIGLSNLSSDNAMKNAMKDWCFFSLVSFWICVTMLAAEPQLVFEDRFDGKLAEGWTWLREDTNAWRLHEGGLEIRVQPGDANSVKDALVRQAPDRRQGRFAIEVTVRNAKRPVRQFEQAGITWYHEGKPVFKLVKELVDGQLMIIPSRKPMTNDAVQLRLVVSADSWTAQFRPDGQGDFITAESGKLPPPGDDQVSLQCYHGPPDAEHWIRFDDFRILRLSD